MRLTVIVPPAVALPVAGYGGIEVAAQDFATELARTGNKVTVMANIADGRSQFGWVGRNILTETDPLSTDKYDLLRDADAVIDFTHSKVPRMARMKKYRSVTMWTDGRSGHDIYPSQAVREAFQDPKAPVIPLGVPVDGLEIPEPVPGRYLSLGRIAPYKGQADAVRMAKEAGVKLTVAGHTGQFADAYYSLCVRKMCRDAGFEFVADPPNLNAMLDGAAGLVHLHNWIESFSLVAAHALVRGIPILTTDIGAPQEWVRACDGGMVVSLEELQAGRPEASAIARGFFETNWASKREGIAKRARELFDIRNVAAQHLKLLEEA